MDDFSEHPTQPLAELEVFVGFIINRTGIQTHRQRDKSIKLKDEFERITAWIVNQMRNPTSATSKKTEQDSLELCLACVHVGCMKDVHCLSSRVRTNDTGLESFKVVAAAVLLRELDAFERGLKSAHTNDDQYGL
jgi:hypothetical protein